jgi:hypothetical protein
VPRPLDVEDVRVQEVECDKGARPEKLRSDGLAVRALCSSHFQVLSTFTNPPI